MAKTQLATQLFNTRRPWSYVALFIVVLAFVQLWNIGTSESSVRLAPPPPVVDVQKSDDPLLSPRCREARHLLEEVKENVVPKNQEQKAKSDGSVEMQDAKWWWANRLPKPGCWEYEERYGAYRNLSPEVIAAIEVVNQCNAEAAAAGKSSGRTRDAIVLRTSEKEGFNEDVQLHTKALVIELGSIGWEIYHVIHLEKSDEESKAWIKQKVPGWMQSFTIPIRFDQASALWPGKLQSFYFDNQGSVGWFQKTHGPFDRLYVLEADVRYVGRWDDFLSSVDLDYKYYHVKHPNHRNLPVHPDFTTFELVAQVKPDWWGGKTLEPKYPYEMGRHSLGVIWGYSAKFLDTMDKALLERGSAYFETIIPTIANVYNLTTFQPTHTIYGPKKDFAVISNKYAQIGDWDVSMHSENGPQMHGGTYKYEGPEAENWYLPWKAGNVTCRSAGLLHPVKH